MAIAYILAHYDDEYCAWPLIRQRARQGESQWFFYVCDYETEALTARRLRETRRLLAELDIDPERAVPVRSGAQDGALHQGAAGAYAALAQAVKRVPRLERLTSVAWEGGHADHDLCAAMAVRLSQTLPEHPPVEQFGLYQGRGLAGPLFKACDPIAENGPVTRMRVHAGDWVDHALAVRFIPSQWRTWIGLWPAMFATFLLRGFGYQALAAQRVLERPHKGALLYERRNGVSYATVRAAADEVLGL